MFALWTLKSIPQPLWGTHPLLIVCFSIKIVNFIICAVLFYPNSAHKKSQ